MAIDVDKTAANRELHGSFMRAQDRPTTDCMLKGTIDFVMGGKRCLTYRYILLTALLAKSVDPRVDILSLQAGDKSAGAYDARSLASRVVFPFQKSMLGNVLDGSNSDPLVNKPGRFLRLKKDNAAASGDSKKALLLLCNNLPKVETSAQARSCLDYIVSLLLAEKERRDASAIEFSSAAGEADVFLVRSFLSDLLDQGFGGAALVLVCTALYRLAYPADDYVVMPHPVNQSGRSKRQYSDLDLYRGGKPFLGTELKDKPFIASDVDHAAETAYAAGASSLLFVAGRQSTFASQPPTYFASAREKYARLGMYVGVTSIDALMDTVLATHVSLNASEVLDGIRKTSEDIGALEAQVWVYGRLSEL